MQQLLSSFGYIEPAHWDHLLEHAYFRNEKGELQLSYDPRILDTVTVEDIDLWSYWESIQVPVLVLRGANSEVLEKATVDKMLKKERVSYGEFPDVGHAPALMNEEQVSSIINWLMAQ